MSSLSKSFYKIAFISSLGTAIEWAEYALYGYLAVHLSSLFFPSQDPRVSLLVTFGVFAAGFIMRPLGAVFFGHISDVKGRKNGILYSLFILGIATFCIGILPTYSVLGLWAPILLLICRLVQGLAVANEMHSASIFLIEHSKTYPHLAGSWPGMAAALGVTVGGLAAMWVSHSEYIWAWRVPFLLGGLSCWIGVYFRKKIAESPEFLLTQANHHLVKIPFFISLKGQWIALFKTAAIAVFVATLIYVCNLYFVTFLIQIGNMYAHHALWITTLGELMVVLFFPIAGFLADRYGGLRLMRQGLLLFILFAPFIFILGKTGNFYAALLAQFIYAFFDALITAPMFKWLYDQFPTHIRVTSVTVAWNTAVALLGGTSPFIVQYLLFQLNLTNGPGFYISLLALIVAGVLFIPNPRLKRKCEEAAALSTRIKLVPKH